MKHCVSTYLIKTLTFIEYIYIQILFFNNK